MAATRIAGTYGPSAVLTLEPLAPRGTRARIDLPVQP